MIYANVQITMYTYYRSTLDNVCDLEIHWHKSNFAIICACYVEAMLNGHFHQRRDSIKSCSTSIKSKINSFAFMLKFYKQKGKKGPSLLLLRICTVVPNRFPEKSHHQNALKLHLLGVVLKIQCKFPLCE